MPKDIIGIADYFMKQFNALWNAIFLNIENVRTMIEELRFNFGYKQASENIEFETLKRENAALVEFLIKIAPNMRDEIESEMKNLEYMKTIEDINLGVNYSYEYAQLLDERGFKSEALEYVNQMKLKMIEYAAMKENEKYLFSSDIRNEYLKAADNFNIIAEQIKQ
ncbi:hypothetical protein KKG31_07225 [Patescibacteria group bacterium]|nr:hypothetical protein [Patescibacteria group bacterium]